MNVSTYVAIHGPKCVRIESPQGVYFVYIVGRWVGSFTPFPHISSVCSEYIIFGRDSHVLILPSCFSNTGEKLSQGECLESLFLLRLFFSR